MDPGYQLHDHILGKGAFGSVRLATHLKTGLQVAVKVVNKAQAAKDLFRIKTEISALSQLRHPNIAKLLQVCEDSENMYIIQEYCSRGELFDYLCRRKKLSELDALRIFKSLIYTLAFIHMKGFAHRDIKLENVLLNERLEIKLIDFGLAASCESHGGIVGLTTWCGSPAYVAPELLKGQEYSGPSADVWSCGVLLFAMLTGRLPFHDISVAAMYHKIKGGKFNMPAWLHPDIKDLICRMLCVDPVNRISIEAIANHRWLQTDLGVNRGKFHDLVKQRDESAIDQTALERCNLFFPDKDVDKIKELIEDNNYYCATYWLLKLCPDYIPVTQEIPSTVVDNRRRSRSFSDAESVTLMTSVVKTQPKRSKPIANTAVKQQVPPRNVPKKPQVVVKRRLFEEKPLNKSNLSSDSNKENKPHKTSSKPIKTPNKPIKTPNKPNKDQESETCKKSLFKRLLDSATPRKNNQPREVSMYQSKLTLESITMTNYTNVEECSKDIVELMTTRYINTNVKNSTIRCVLSSRDLIIVAFELELVWCREKNALWIIQKLIRGKSMDFNSACTHLKKLPKYSGPKRNIK